MASLWGTTPRDSIRAVCEQRGVPAVIEGCLALIRGRDADPGLIAALAGPTSVRYLDAPEDQRYWLRVWGARGLLWAITTEGDDLRVAKAIVVALGDGHWRVREMAAKVAARHRIEAVQPALAELLTDENERVRAAAARAIRVL
jgi:HEAT repeat protein